MSEFTQNVKMQFAQRIRDGQCVICGEKQPVDDLEIQNIQMPIEEQKGGFFYHKKCLPKVTVDFAKSMINSKTLDDINNMLNS
ncbi:hypothetical protein [Nitrosopumilus sp.]|uniref:hypothetical protein n=1 Tax=Nitrosopumilus sp. TaxID=2024843 RepID=UPI0026217FB4|nr:hypothetical protein [Nitrosopumilus sp.]